METLKNKTASEKISDEAVLSKTGKKWDEWFSILDKADATSMTHKEIVAYLNKEHEVSPWWQQMLTVAYEQARGMRELHQKEGGYEISASKTVSAPVAFVYEAFTKEESRKEWLENKLAIRKATPDKSIRITWEESQTHVSVMFYPKGVDKVQITIQHTKLRNLADAERMKSFWKGALERFK